MFHYMCQLNTRWHFDGYTLSLTSPVPGKYSPNLWKDTVITLIGVHSPDKLIYNTICTTKPVSAIERLLDAITVVNIYVNIHYALMHLVQQNISAKIV